MKNASAGTPRVANGATSDSSGLVAAACEVLRWQSASTAAAPASDDARAREAERAHHHPAAGPADHVEVDHRDRSLERDDRVPDVVLEPSKPQLLAGEGHEHDRPAEPRSRAPRRGPRHLDDRRRAGGVVVRAVVDLSRQIRRLRELRRRADVVVVRADDDGLVRRARHPDPRSTPTTLRSGAVNARALVVADRAASSRRDRGASVRSMSARRCVTRSSDGSAWTSAIARDAHDRHPMCLALRIDPPGAAHGRSSTCDGSSTTISRRAPRSRGLARLGRDCRAGVRLATVEGAALVVLLRFVREHQHRGAAHVDAGEVVVAEARRRDPVSGEHHRNRRGTPSGGVSRSRIDSG